VVRKMYFSGSLGKNLQILVDDVVYDWASLCKWYWKKGDPGYATRAKKVNGKCVYYFLHKEILGVHLNKEILVDHINGNPLDCRRENLRLANRKENAQNRRVLSHRRYKGIAFKKYANKTNPWEARIRVDSKLISLGYHRQMKDAALAYNKAAVFYFKEFARLNEVA